jgi:hypothetical protein
MAREQVDDVNGDIPAFFRMCQEVCEFSVYFFRQVIDKFLRDLCDASNFLF